MTAVLPVSLAAKIGLTVGYDTLIADPAASRTTPEREERLRDVTRTVSASATITVERGFQDRLAATLLAFALGAAVLVLGGTFAATGLAAAEGRPDRATLAAVGATGRVQRLLVAGQAAFVSGLGVAGGVAVGLAFGVAGVLSMASARRPFAGGMPEDLAGAASFVVDVPWLLLGGVLLGLPPLAGLCVRTGVVLTRRPT
ncbi:hypothetical protein [Streptosporangium sp. V21-05]|uniref:hypothetical protein n=1 Tax=Streptosporangium sp. V21-05 TaxID=3446115 RepID=UPI003F52EC53